MARKLRIQFPGAIYHVINRGNYKSDVFGEPGAAQAFVETLEEAVDRYGWRLGGYVVMRNHFHLAVQTPEPNLTLGMHWLQCTFATRFNRLRKENGHLFQGRYRAILLESNSDLARVVDYIHLNPVRTGLVSSEQAVQFRWSSLNRFFKNQRFNGLSTIGWMQSMGLEDSAEGWREYGNRLQQKANLSTDSVRAEHTALTSGWAIGSDTWKETTLSTQIPDDMATKSPNLGRLSSEILSVKWALRLKQELTEAGKSQQDLVSARKGADWKIAIANRLQRELGVSIKWIASELHMGRPGSVRANLWKYRKNLHITT